MSPDISYQQGNKNRSWHNTMCTLHLAVAKVVSSHPFFVLILVIILLHRSI